MQKGFGHVPEPGAYEVAMDSDIGREAYIGMFGPTVGDRVRLGDTALWVEVERDEVGVLFLSVWDVLIRVVCCRLSMETKSSSEEVRTFYSRDSGNEKTDPDTRQDYP